MFEKNIFSNGNKGTQRKNFFISMIYSLKRASKLQLFFIQSKSADIYVTLINFVRFNIRAFNRIFPIWKIKMRQWVFQFKFQIQIQNSRWRRSLIYHCYQLYVLYYLRYTFRLITSVPRSNSLFPSSSPGGKSQVGGENKGGGGPVVLQGQYSLSRMGLHLLEAGEVPFGRVVLRQGDQTDPEQWLENVSRARQGAARLR